MTRMGFVLPFSGLLRAYGDDLNRLQRLLDPLLVTALFWWLVLPRSQGSSGREDLATLVLVCLASAVVLPQGRLYQSYRQASLLTLLRRLSVSWLLVLAGLLTLAYGLKVSANYSRLDMLAWAGWSWLALVLLHLGGRKLLRWYRIRGGNSRLLVYWGPPRAAEAFTAASRPAPIWDCGWWPGLATARPLILTLCFRRCRTGVAACRHCVPGWRRTVWISWCSAMVAQPPRPPRS